MSMFGNILGRQYQGSPYQSFASQFRPQGMLGQQIPQQGMFGGFMPQIAAFQSAIGRDVPDKYLRKGGKKGLGQMDMTQFPLQYNPIVPLRYQTTQSPIEQTQPVANVATQAPQPGVAQTPVEQALMNRTMGRPAWQGINTDSLTRQDYADWRLAQRRANPRQNAPRHRRGIYK